MKDNIKLNKSNRITENAVNRVQNSLNKLQSVINNNSNIKNRNANTNLNNRRKIIDNNNYGIKRENNINNTEINIQQQPPIGYSMFNKMTAINTDKRIQKPNSDYKFEKIIYTTEYIPKTNQSRNNNANKKNYFSNNNKDISTSTKWKCMNCGNINLLYNNSCINCGKMKNKNLNLNNYYTADNNIKYLNNSYENINNNYNNNFLQYNSSNKRIEKNNDNQNRKNILKNNFLYNQNNEENNDEDIIFKDFNPEANSEKNIIENNIDNSNITNITDNNINRTFNMGNNYFNPIYKKLNDLYLYGDYLENELKESNDENIKLLEKYKNIKNDVHNLNQKNNKLKQNIELLQKKDNELNKLNDQLKNGFSFVKQKIEKDNNENMNILKQLNVENNNILEKQKVYDEEIENLKNKISLIVNEEENEENNEKDKIIKDIENNIEKDKNEILENNNKYILYLKDNELLNQDIEQLQKKLEEKKLYSGGGKSSPNTRGNFIKKLNMLKEEMLLYDNQIKENKKITQDLIDEYKNTIDVSKKNINNDDNIDESDKNEYLLIKEKNNKLTNELAKLKNIISNLEESKDKIIEIYEDEIGKLNNFYKKAKEKTEKSKENKDEEKIMKIIKENEEIKKENFDFIKD